MPESPPTPTAAPPLEGTLARYRAILASTLDPVVTIDAYGVIQEASDSVRRVLGYDPAELIGRNISILMPEPHHSAHDGYLANYRRTGATNILGRSREFEAVRKDGTRFPIELSVSRVDVPGQDHPLFTGIIRDLTDQKAAQQALAASEQRFREILENVEQIAVMLDREGRVIFCNQYLADLVGAPRDALIGHDWFDTVLPADVAPGIRDMFLKAMESSSIASTFENEIVTRDGRRRLIAWSNVLTRDAGGRVSGATGLGADVTERRRAEQETRLLQTLTMTISQASDLQTAMVQALQTLCAATEWEYGEAWLPDVESGRLTCAAVWHTSAVQLDRFEATTRQTRLELGRGLPGRVWAVKEPEWIPDLANGDIFLRHQAALSAGLKAGLGVPILFGGEVVAVVAFFMTSHREEDARLIELVTAAVAPLGPVIERKRAEDELVRYRDRLEELVAQRTSELSASQEQLRQADRLASIGTLAAGLGHDMNNTLLPIRCRLDVLEALNLPTAARTELEIIRRSVDYLQQLSDGLHLLALDPSEVEGAEAATNLSVWWGQIGPLLTKTVPRHAFFAVSLPADLPPVTVAPHRMTQVVLNLVVNAAEAIGEGGRISLWARKHDGESLVQVGVTDNGRGMSEEVRLRALEPFFSTKQRGLGTGLGLSLVHGVAKAAGGGVAIDSASGAGTTVMVTLPAAEAHRTRRGLAGEGLPLRTTITLDDAHAAAFISALLRSEELNVQRADEPGECDLWITEPSDGRCEAAQRFLENRSKGSVIVCGEAGPEWERLGARIIGDLYDFERLREAVGEVVALHAGS